MRARKQLRRTAGLIWLGAALATGTAAWGADDAVAVVSLPRLLDGPSADLTGDVDAAMAEDGTGGVVYLKRESGRAHVFAAPFANGIWGAAQRVDVGQPFDSSWPRIAAGNGGRLLVTWVEEFGVQSDRIYSATMDPGAGGFLAPVPVDINVGEATATFPDLAMSRGGTAYLAYNVVTDTSPANPPGYLGADVRVSRYSNRLWTSVGRVDRNSVQPMRTPAAAIGPRVGVDLTGQGVVAWLEPDDEFVDRVWARRLFGGQTGIPLLVSPQTFGGLPLRGGVDAFSLDVSGFGWASAAFRQLPGQSSALASPRVMTNQIPDTSTADAGQFYGAQLADGGAFPAVGPPSVAVDPEGYYLATFGSGASTLAATGDDFGLSGLSRIDTGASSIEGDPVVDLADSGAGVVAWRELRSGVGVLRVQERRADRVNDSTTLSAPRGGAVGPPALGGSGLGDAIVAWSQGSGPDRQVATAVVDAPPDPFLVFVERGWRRERMIPVSWDPAPHAIGGVRYSISVDDEPVLDRISGLGASLGRRQIGNGVHTIDVFAVDDAGQETASLRAVLRVDRSPPKVRTRSRGTNLSVVVGEGRGKSSGIRSVRVSFGDGSKAAPKPKGGGARVRVKHAYSRRGTFTVVVKAIDRAKNEVKFRKKVRVG